MLLLLALLLRLTLLRLLILIPIPILILTSLPSLLPTLPILPIELPDITSRRRNGKQSGAETEAVVVLSSCFPAALPSHDVVRGERCAGGEARAKLYVPSPLPSSIVGRSVRYCGIIPSPFPSEGAAKLATYSSLRVVSSEPAQLRVGSNRPSRDPPPPHHQVYDVFCTQQPRSIRLASCRNA